MPGDDVDLDAHDDQAADRACVACGRPDGQMVPTATPDSPSSPHAFRHVIACERLDDREH